MDGRATIESFSIRQVLRKIGLVEAGGNYAQIKKGSRPAKPC